MGRRVVWSVLAFLLGGCSDEPRSSPTPPAVTRSANPPRATHSSPRTTEASSGDTQASLRVLEEAVQSSDYSVRLLAVDALGDVDDAFALRWLNEALGDPEHDVRLAAVEALGRRASAARAALLRTVRDDAKEELEIRALAASALLGRRESCR